ncbi:ABC transporter permease [Jannaschia sp. Os4]|uniref:ABC transporter permease n=1 Tax=Jannaschia sp. Os4 TaxID=2807617 RepID=UPI00193A3BA8|nr:ABC transporter permease [Jannaschia sp. Os4]MBM2576587.1 ABC transporter permease [Jannaschia sp. Os4]
MLRPLPLLTVLVLAGPVALGLAGTVLPALGWLPAAGLTGWSLAPLRAVADWPGLPAAAGVSLSSGLLSTAGALLVATLLLAGWHGTPVARALERLLSPLLAVPHAAAALGLAFLIAPSGWIVRVAAGPLGLDRPPDALVVQDPWGLALTAGLIAKEVPFLLLMMLAALPQADPARRLRVARSLGQGRVAAWLKAVFPTVYAQVRLPVLVVLVYGMTNVDVAAILGPSTPPTLSVQVTRWMVDPDLAMRAVGAAGAVVQLALVAGALAAWRIGERGVARAALAWTVRARGLPEAAARGTGAALGLVSALGVLGGLAALALWSVAARWRFPDAWPEGLTARTWMRHGPEMLEVAGATLGLALAATAASLLLVVGCLEAEHRHRLGPSRALWLLYLPLLVPQIAFLPGLALLPLWLGASAGWGAVTAVHVVFVLPYVFLSLSGPWRAWDDRTARVAAGLGRGPDAVLWRLRLPMLLAPVLTAVAVGMAVSVGQYLPTLLIGGGRTATLTTEAVALAAGGDRRAIGAWGIGQAGAAFAPFALALLVPALAWRNRRGMGRG